MPRPMPSMLTTLIEKIDTSPSTVAPDEHGERGDDTGEGDEHGHAGGAQSAEQEDHGDEGDRQRDCFAAEQVVLGRGAELLPDEHVPADEHLGGVEVAGDIGDLDGRARLRPPRRGHR